MTGVLGLSGCALLPPESALENTGALPHVECFTDVPPGNGRPGGWQPWAIAKFKRPTDYRLVNLDGRTVMRASANSSASGLVHPAKIDPKEFPLLHWHWKVDKLIEKADNTRRSTEDSPVRLIVGFDGDIDSLAFGDRMFFNQVKAITGWQLPYAMLMYIWENHAPKDTVIPSFRTSRIKMIVAESGKEKVGKWREETRNVYEDFKRAFGEEPGTITAIGIMTDTDNTGEEALAYYGDITCKRTAFSSD